MPTVTEITERDTTVVSLTCTEIHDMIADDGEAYTKLRNVTVKTSAESERKFPDSCFEYYENPMSHHYCSLIEMGGKNSYVSRDERDRPSPLVFTQLPDGSWVGKLASPDLERAAEVRRWGFH